MTNQLAQPVTTFGELVNKLVDVIFADLPLIILALAGVYFLWNLAVMVGISGDDSKVKEEARGKIGGSLLVIFVMVTVWGLVKVLRDTVDLNDAPIDVDISHPSNRINHLIN